GRRCSLQERFAQRTQIGRRPMDDRERESVHVRGGALADGSPVWMATNTGAGKVAAVGDR
ncbi:hypothetical protein GGF46_000002, partial [Coemansia sp. RSA 552]